MSSKKVEEKVEEKVVKMEAKEKSFAVKESILNAVLQYLQTKPYQEVARLIGAIQQGAKPLED